MKAKLFFALLFVVTCGVSAQTTHTVSQDTGDSPDFSSVSAAIAAAASGDTIRILDSATYDEDFPIIVQTLTIEAAAGQTPTLERSAGGNAAQAIRFNSTTGNTLTIRGASEAARLTVRSSFDLGAGIVAPVINTGPNIEEAHAIALENVIIEIPNTLDGVMLNFNNLGAHTLTNVDFVGRRPDSVQTILNCQALGGLTVTNCDFGAAIGTTDFGGQTQTSGYILTVQARTAGGGFTTEGSGDFVFNNCDISANSSANSPAGCVLIGGAYGGNITFNDCSFDVGSFSADPSVLNSQSLEEPAITFNRPVFTGSGGGVAFLMEIGAGNGPTLNINGTPQSKVNLDPLVTGGTVLYFRLGGGTINLTDVQASISGFGAFLDTFNAATPDSIWFADVNVNLNRCILRNEAGGFWMWEGDGGSRPDPGSPFGASVTMTNTIYAGGANSGFGAVNISSPQFPDNRTGADSLTLNHATIAGDYQAGQYIFNLADTATIEGNFSIVDFSGSTLGPSFATPLTGQGNLLNAPNWVGDQFPADTIIGDPALNSGFKLTELSAALDAATGSTEAVDVDGQSRPGGGANDIGADELLFINAAEFWSLF